MLSTAAAAISERLANGSEIEKLEDRRPLGSRAKS
jgi:hypothetical protein